MIPGGPRSSYFSVPPNPTRKQPEPELLQLSLGIGLKYDELCATLEIRSDEFRVQGRRAAAIYDAHQKKFQQVIPSAGGKIKIVVRTPTDTLSDSAPNTLSDRIFLTQLAEQDLPETWRDFFMGKQRMSKDFAERSHSGSRIRRTACVSCFPEGWHYSPEATCNARPKL